LTAGQAGKDTIMSMSKRAYENWLEREAIKRAAEERRKKPEESVK
jgi:hypothetical protein